MTEVKIKFKDDAEARKVAAWLADRSLDTPISSGLAEAIASQIKEQVQPEYPEGTFARVRMDGGRRQFFAVRKDGSWTTAGGHPMTSDWNVDDVEPIRTLANDEIAVKRLPEGNWRSVARRSRIDGYELAASVADRYADALEAEARGK